MQCANCTYCCFIIYICVCAEVEKVRTLFTVVNMYMFVLTCILLAYKHLQIFSAIALAV